MSSKKTQKTDQKESFLEKHDIISWILMGGALIILLLTYYIYKCIYNNPVIIPIAILLAFVISTIGFINNQRHAKMNERISLLNDGFYINKEINRYRNIGKNDDNEKVIDTHEKWQNDISESLKQATDKYEKELFRCLIRIYRQAKRNSDITKSIMLPIELGIITVVTDKTEELYKAVIIVVVASLVLIGLYVAEAYDSDIKMSFVKDTIEAIYGKDKLHDLELLG